MIVCGCVGLWEVDMSQGRTCEDTEGMMAQIR